ncbi:hypothetical protein NMY22_g6405 [Coprinellus aureogranulatus]|nr:hypothetical protein NMY22_g6405 [Coprinellus aureogranulatus]
MSVRRKLHLTDEERQMYKSERLDNFRWISRIVASYSKVQLKDADRVPKELCEQLSDIGQFAEIVYSTTPIESLLKHYDLLSRSKFPLEGCTALDGATLDSSVVGDVASLPAAVFWRPSHRQVVVAICGTKLARQALQDVRALKRRHPSGKGQVHTGFWSMYMGLRERLMSVLTGHSMGGAIAYLLGIDLLAEERDSASDQRPLLRLSSSGSQNPGSALALKLVTFGMPRVGDQALVEYFYDLVDSYQNRHGKDRILEASVRTYNDGVPTLPPLALGYRHFARRPVEMPARLSAQSSSHYRCRDARAPERTVIISLPSRGASEQPNPLRTRRRTSRLYIWSPPRGGSTISCPPPATSKEVFHFKTTSGLPERLQNHQDSLHRTPSQEGLGIVNRQSPIDLTHLYDTRGDPILNASIPCNKTVRYTAPHSNTALVEYSSRISIDLLKQKLNHSPRPGLGFERPRIAMSTSSRCRAAFALSDLPRHGDREAPRWDGSPLTLQDFLDDFEDMCRRYRVPQERMIDALLRIAPSYDTRAFWKCLVSEMESERSWIKYRKVLVSRTPGADEDHRYTRADLAELVDTYRGMSTLSMEDFGRLWTRFFAISEFLQSHGRLSEGERSNKLLECLPSPHRARVKSQHRRQYPRHHAEDPLPLKEVYDAIMFVLSIGQEYFEDELVPRTQKTSSSEQHQSERREQLSHSLRESTRELSMSVEKTSDAIKTFANKPREFNSNARAIAKPNPTPPFQSLIFQQQVSCAQTDSCCEPSRLTSKEVSHEDTDEYEEEDIPFVEAMLLNQARGVHRARETLSHARSRSAKSIQSTSESILRYQDSQHSLASSNLVANYIKTISQNSPEPQQELSKESLVHRGSESVPDSSCTASTSHNKPSLVNIERNTLKPVVLEKEVVQAHCGDAIVGRTVEVLELRTVDPEARQVVQDIPVHSRRDLITSFVAVVPSIESPSLSSIESQPAFKTVMISFLSTDFLSFSIFPLLSILIDSRDAHGPPSQGIKTFYLLPVPTARTHHPLSILHIYSRTHTQGIGTTEPPQNSPAHFASLQPIYATGGDLYYIPSSEKERSLFHVDEDSDSTPEAKSVRFPRGGHNYYGGRELERLHRRLVWLEKSGFFDNVDEWEDRYLSKAQKSSAI